MSEGEGGHGHEEENPMESFWKPFEAAHTVHGLADVATMPWGGLEGGAKLLGASEELAGGIEGVGLGIGGGLGALNLGKGAAELWQAGGDLGSSKGSQGGLAMLSGGLGVAAMACPALAPAAAIAGLGAFGNEAAEKNGWYGTDEKGNNRTFFGGIGHGAEQGWDWGHSALGDNFAGDALGTVAGGVDAAGHAVWNTGAALAGAGYRMAEGVDDAAHWAGGKLADAGGWVGDKASGAWDAVTDW